jgi:hypothetical protein
MLLKPRYVLASFGALGLALPAVLPSCNAKSGLREARVDAGAPIDATADADAAPECSGPEDCISDDLCNPVACIDGLCLPAGPVECNDGDECTEDSCVPESGECDFRELALDQDGDGFKGPKPGFAAGAPGSCGDDCDDTNPKAFPGGVEVCDGADNDCNGIIDDNATYVPTGLDAIRISELEAKQAGRGGMAYNGEIYGAAYTAQTTRWRTYVKGIAPDGSVSFGQMPITNVNNDTFTGPVVWTGAIFATAWEDRRDNDYEIYFNRFDKNGNKLGPDIRITNAPDFSLHPHMIWNGAEFMLVWDDRRNGDNDYRIYGQRIDVDGNLLGDNIELTNPFWGAESPWIAEGEKRMALVFNMGNAVERQIGLRLLDPDFGNGTDLIFLDTQDGTTPNVVWNKDRYVIVYHKRTNVPGDAIWGLTVDEDGNILTPETKLTTGASFARTQSILPLGDRLLLVWADDKDGNYELYTKMLSPTLAELSPRQRITNNSADSVFPFAAFGPEGDVGVLFDDRRSGSWQVYFTRLVCQAGPGG